MVVGEHLDLDVAGVGQVALEVDGRVGEELLAFPARALEGVLQLVLAERHAKALAAAAAGGLHGDRKADRRLATRGVSTFSTGSFVPGTIGTPAPLHQLAGAPLRAHRLVARRRPDETIPACSQSARSAFSARKP